MITNSRSIQGILYLDAILKKIELEKELFIADLEQGKECFIPKELSQDTLPYSFRYYDPIIQIVQENVSENKRENFALR